MIGIKEVNEFASPQTVKEVPTSEEKKAGEVASYVKEGGRSSADEGSDLSEQEDDVEGREKESTATRSSRGRILRSDG